MGITNSILKWNNEKIEQLSKEELTMKNWAKLFCHGAVGGFIDGCMITGAVVVTVGYASKIVKTIKK